MSGYDLGEAAKTGVFSGRFYHGANTTTAFAGNALTFSDPTHGEFVASGIKIRNDSANEIEFSFDGVNVHGVVLGNSEENFEKRYERNIWLRSAAGGDAYRVFAW